MIDPRKVALFFPDNLKKFKWKLFKQIGEHIEKLGGQVVMHDPALLADLPADVIPIIGCHPMCRPQIDSWIETGRTFIYWDRGYTRRIFATWLPRGDNGGYYRWHINSFQMRQVRDVPKDRWKDQRTDTMPWAIDGKHIVVAAPSLTYSDFHGTYEWTNKAVETLRKFTDRKIVIRDKLCDIPLADHLRGAHALVSHQSNAAVESVILGCPVFVDPGSAAALVGHTDLSLIESPIYPDRKPWLRSLAYCQFNEAELVNGTLWRLLA